MKPIEISADFGSITGANWLDMNIVGPNGEAFGYADAFLNSGGPITQSSQSSPEAYYSGCATSTESFIFNNPMIRKWQIRIHYDGGGSTSTFTVKSNYHIIGLSQVIETTNTTTNTIVKELHLKIQVGSNDGQHLWIDLSGVRTNALGLDKIDLTSVQTTDNALAIIDNAVQLVSQERSKYDAYMNALEHLSQIVSNTYENLTKAESQLRDANMAKEMTKLQKDQVLLQASQSIMAQINQMCQGILELLM